MKSRDFALLIMSLMIVPNVGCQSWTYVRDSIFFCEPIDGAIHSHNCHRAAKRAWAERYDHYCDRECADYFGAGFRDGYADVARGGTGCPPPLPPRRYWGWRYQNALGQQRVAAWFDGYPAGARAAEEDGVANWSRMQTSYIIDAQYAARMNGGRRGGTVPATGAFPGEELEEVPAPAAAAAPDAAPETVVPNTAAPDAAVPGATLPETPVPAPAEPPAGSSTSAPEKPEEVRVLRNLDQAMPVSSKVADQPKVRLIPQIVAAPAQRKSVVTAIEPAEASPLPENSESEPAASEPIVSEAKLPSPVRDLTATEVPVGDSAPEVKDLPMPAVEILSGLSVPKKQTALVEEVTEVEMAESDSEELEMPLAEEIVTSKQPALVRSPALTPIETPENRSSAAPTAGIVGESPAYNLGSNEASSAGPTSSASSSNTTTNSTKRTLPPIVPSKPKKLTTPIVLPVEAPGRLTKLASPLPAKQVSFESDEDAEVPGLRRIGKSK